MHRGLNPPEMPRPFTLARWRDGPSSGKCWYEIIRH